MDNLSLFVKLGLDMQKFEKGLTQASQKMQAFGKSMTKTGKDLSMKVTAPVVGLGAVILNTAGNFEAAMNKVQAVSGATGSEFEALEKQARELGATTQFSATQAAEAMTFLSMAGFEANEILGAMPSTLNLAAAAQLDMGSAADIVSNIMAGFNMTSEELSGAVDVLAKQFTTSNTNLSQLGEAMKYVAPVASGLGVSIEETSAAIGMLSDAGIQGSMAGTGLRRILSTLSRESDKLGVNVYDADGTLRGFADILEDLQKTGIDTTKIMEVFGDRGGPAMVALLSRGSDAIREQTKVLEAAGGTAEKISKTQMKGLNGALKALRSAFEELFLAIAESGLLDAVTSFAQRLTQTVRQLSEANPRLLNMVTVVAALAAALGPLLIIVGQISIGLGAVTTAVKLLTAALIKNPFTLLLVGGTALVALLMKVRSNLRDTSDEIKSLEQLQQEAADSTVKQTGELIKLFNTVKYGEKDTKRYKDAVSKLNQLYPNYLKNINLEKSSLEDINKIQNSIIDGLKEKAVMALAEKELSSLYENQAKDLMELQAAQDRVAQTMESYRAELDAAEKAGRDLSVIEQDYEEILDGLNGQVDLLNRNYEAKSHLINELAKQYGRVIDEMTDFNVQAGQGNELQGKGNEIQRESIQLNTQQALAFDKMATAVSGFVVRAQEAIPLTYAFTDRTQQFADVVMRAAQNYAQFLTPAINGAFNALAQGENVFKGIMEGLKQMIVQLVKAVAQAAILAAIMNILAPGSSAAAGGVLGIFKNLVGLQGFANGGVPPVGRPSIVGERGPELFVPHSKGTVVPNGMLGGGEVTFRIQGRELVGILGRESKMTNRL